MQRINALRMAMLRGGAAVCSLVGLLGTPAAARAEEVIFFDDFGPKSHEDVLIPNPTVQQYPNALKEGHPLTRWHVHQTVEDWRQGFWVVPEGADYMVQAGRSHDSRVVAEAAVPADTTRYRVEFRQWVNDNDRIFYIIGADATGRNGTEFGYMRQTPGTDETTDAGVLVGALGENVEVEGIGRPQMRRWVTHTIDVDGKKVAWRIEDRLIAEKELPDLRRGGHFGIRHRYERNTRYDDVKIIIFDGGEKPFVSANTAGAAQVEEKR